MLSDLQHALEIIYGVSSPGRVEDFLMQKAALLELGAIVRAPEELFVLQQPEGVEIALYISDDILASLPRLQLSGALLEGFLPAYSTAAEGVSHFVYLSLQAMRDRAVSLLELEVQAEIDKFATALLYLWRRGERQRSGELRSRLFDHVGYRADLDPGERDRYAIANRLARGYSAFLESKFIADNRLEGLLRELRHAYRLPSTDKFDYLAQHA